MCRARARAAPRRSRSRPDARARERRSRARARSSLTSVVSREQPEAQTPCLAPQHLGVVGVERRGEAVGQQPVAEAQRLLVGVAGSYAAPRRASAARGWRRAPRRACARHAARSSRSRSRASGPMPRRSRRRGSERALPARRCGWLCGYATRACTYLKVGPDRASPKPAGAALTLFAAARPPQECRSRRFGRAAGRAGSRTASPRSRRRCASP